MWRVAGCTALYFLNKSIVPLNRQNYSAIFTTVWFTTLVSCYNSKENHTPVAFNITQYTTCIMYFALNCE